MAAILDAATGVLFLLAALFAWFAWRADGGRPGGRFWLIAAAGLLLLGVDELTGAQDWAHERLHDVGIPDPPLLEGLDDLFMLIGGLVAAAVCAWYWRELRRDHRALAWFVSAAALLALAFANDSFGPTGGWLPETEEGLECLAALLLAIGTRTAWHGIAAAGQRVTMLRGTRTA